MLKLYCIVSDLGAQPSYAANSAPESSSVTESSQARLWLESSSEADPSQACLWLESSERPILRANAPGLRSFAFTSTSCTSLLKLLPRFLHRLSCSFRAYLGSNRRRKDYAKGCNQISSDPRHWTETYLFHHLSSSLLVFLASSPSGSSNILTMKLYKLGK